MGDQVLTPGSGLSFVLVADSTGSLPGGVLQVSDTPTFNFNPATMATGVNYFVAAVAALGPPGAPNWAAGCFDLSFFKPVRWLPLPTVAVAANSQQVCNTACANVPLSLTGAFPINLGWQINFGAVTQTGNFVANSASSLLTICPAGGGAFPTGAFQLQFLTISDAVCGCP